MERIVTTIGTAVMAVIRSRIGCDRKKFAARARAAIAKLQRSRRAQSTSDLVDDESLSDARIRDRRVLITLAAGRLSATLGNVAPRGT
jgi:hypothetical protein